MLITRCLRSARLYSYWPSYSGYCLVGIGSSEREVKPHRTFLPSLQVIHADSFTFLLYTPSSSHFTVGRPYTNNRQWSAGGTFGDQTKHDPTSSRFTAAGTRQQRGQTDTFMSGLSDYRQTVSFSAPTGGMDRPRFTNRMAVEEEEEEWEMKDRKGSDDLEEVKTPTTATSIIMMKRGWGVLFI
jgi:hypothetical protein